LNVASPMQSTMHIYEVRPRKDKCGVDLTSAGLPFGRLWYTNPDDAVDYAKFFSQSHDAVIRVYDEAGNVTETHEHRGRLQRAVATTEAKSRHAGGDGGVTADAIKGSSGR